MAEWDSFAQHYDLLFDDRSVDVSFWTSLAKKFGSPILELACGTGRISLPIARLGFAIYGIDISKPMLRIFKKKLSRENTKTKKQIILIQQNANDFNIPRIKFAAIFSPWGFMPKTQLEQKTFFISIKKHLVDNGYLILDLFNFSNPNKDSSNYYLRECEDFPKKNFTLLRHVEHLIDRKIRMGTFIYTLDKIKRNGTHRRYVMKRKERIYTKENLLKLL